MSIFTKLNVVNDMLATLGEAPLNSLEEDHPLTAAALRVLNTVNLQEQAREWWFNKEMITLPADPITGVVVVPADAISCDPIDIALPYTQRGARLYDNATGTYVIGKAVACNLVRLVEFDDLPILARAYISIMCQQQFQIDYDGDATKAVTLASNVGKAYAVLNAEHIRNSGSNFLQAPSIVAKLGSMGGYYSRSVVPFNGVR